jgi:hypothetical protein
MGGPFASDPPHLSLPAGNQTMTVWHAGLAVAVIGFSAAAALGEEVTLWWKFEKNNVYHYVMVNNM